jgi:hypothetical protein
MVLDPDDQIFPLTLPSHSYCLIGVCTDAVLIIY